MAAAVAAPPATADPDARMTPAVRRLLREHELTAAQIVGTGGGGRITREDVLKVVESIRTGGSRPGAGRRRGPGLRPEWLSGPSAPAPAAPAAPAATAPRGPVGAPIEFPEGADEVLLPMTKMRKGIAAQMTRALEVPHAYVHMEVDATNLVRARERREARLPGSRGDLAQLRAVRHQGRRRRAAALSVVQRALDRERASWRSGASTWASRSPSTTG